jgi:hypothetical protein
LSREFLVFHGRLQRAVLLSFIFFLFIL